MYKWVSTEPDYRYELLSFIYRAFSFLPSCKQDWVWALLRIPVISFVRYYVILSISRLCPWAINQFLRFIAWSFSRELIPDPLSPTSGYWLTIIKFCRHQTLTTCTWVFTVKPTADKTMEDPYDFGIVDVSWVHVVDSPQMFMVHMTGWNCNG